MDILTEIKEKTCEYFKISIDDFESKSRLRELVIARQIAHHIAKNNTDYSFELIGAEIAKRNHATVIHSCVQIKNLMEFDANIRVDYQKIFNKIKFNKVKKIELILTESLKKYGYKIEQIEPNLLSAIYEAMENY